MTDLEIAQRLSLALVSGALIGIERQWHHKNAGLKTNTLVAVGAAAFTMISISGFGPLSNPAQVAGGVVTGIGFIGAGVVMRQGSSVQGVNSAATLWATASVGMAFGTGRLILALGVLAATLLAQTVSRSLAFVIDRHSRPPEALGTFRVSVQFSPSEHERVRSLWSTFRSQTEIAVASVSETNAAGGGSAAFETHFTWPQNREREIDALVSHLAALPGVTKSEWSQSNSPEHE